MTEDFLAWVVIVASSVAVLAAIAGFIGTLTGAFLK